MELVGNYVDCRGLGGLLKKPLTQPSATLAEGGTNGGDGDDDGKANEVPRRVAPVLDVTVLALLAAVGFGLPAAILANTCGSVAVLLVCWAIRAATRSKLLFIAVIIVLDR